MKFDKSLTEEDIELILRVVLFHLVECSEDDGLVVPYALFADSNSESEYSFSLVVNPKDQTVTIKALTEDEASACKELDKLDGGVH